MMIRMMMLKFDLIKSFNGCDVDNHDNVCKSDDDETEDYSRLSLP